jgi:hypothetical protein
MVTRMRKIKPHHDILMLTKSIVDLEKASDDSHSNSAKKNRRFSQRVSKISEYIQQVKIPNLNESKHETEESVVPE